MNIELDEGLIKLIKQYDAAMYSPQRHEIISDLCSLIAMRVASKYTIKAIFQEAAKGSEHEDLECLK